jgi:hypothetical protein
VGSFPDWDCGDAVLFRILSLFLFGRAMVICRLFGVILVRLLLFYDPHYVLHWFLFHTSLSLLVYCMLRFRPLFILDIPLSCFFLSLIVFSLISSGLLSFQAIERWGRTSLRVDVASATAPGRRPRRSPLRMALWHICFVCEFALLTCCGRRIVARSLSETF